MAKAMGMLEIVFDVAMILDSSFWGLEEKVILAHAMSTLPDIITRH